MTINYYSNFNSVHNNVNFKENKNVKDFVKKPIQKTTEIINDTVEILSNKDESNEKKSNRKKIIGITSSVLVISSLMFLLNPRISPKITQKLKNISEEAKIKIEKNKNNPLISSYYKVKSFIATGINKGSESVNTANSLKDYFFEWLCCAKKGENIKNNTLKKIVTTTDSGFRKVMDKPHKAITKFFDKIGKSTVFRKNKNAYDNIDVAVKLLEKHKSKLSSAEQVEFEKEIQTILNYQKELSKENVEKRLLHQENLMKDLRGKFSNKLDQFANEFQGFKAEGSFSDKFKHNAKHLSNNMTFWTKDMLQATKDELEHSHLKEIEKLVGNSSDNKGALNQLFDKISPKLNEVEKNALKAKLNLVEKSIKNAHKTEFVEYFDKKRDLTMGGAPTDIVSALALLGLSGIVITKADTTEEKFSKALTVATPAVLGVGTNLALTAMLFSGFQGLAIGAVASSILGKICGRIDKVIHPNVHTKNVSNEVN